MILVFDREGRIFQRLRELDLGVPLWRVADPARLERVTHVELTVVAGYTSVPWELLGGELPFDTMVLTERFDDAEAMEAVSRGLVGYFDVNADEGALRHAIQGCLHGEPAYSRRIFGAWLRRQTSCARAHCSTSRLTTRQREVLLLIAQGLADKEIGEHLGIATATAQKHVTNILERLNVANRAAAAAAVCALAMDPACRAQCPQHVTAPSAA